MVYWETGNFSSSWSGREKCKWFKLFHLFLPTNESNWSFIRKQLYRGGTHCLELLRGNNGWYLCICIWKAPDRIPLPLTISLKDKIKLGISFIKELGPGSQMEQKKMEMMPPTLLRYGKLWINCVPSPPGLSCVLFFFKIPPLLCG